MPKTTFRLTLKSTHKESEKVPDFVTRIQKECHLAEEESSTFMLVLSEAVSNAIEHGNQGDPSKKVVINIEIFDHQIVSEVKDEGEGFDPDTIDNPLKKENLLLSGGRGLFLISELSDSVEYLEKGTKVRFVLKR